MARSLSQYAYNMYFHAVAVLIGCYAAKLTDGLAPQEKKEKNYTVYLMMFKQD